MLTNALDSDSEHYMLIKKIRKKLQLSSKKKNQLTISTTEHLTLEQTENLRKICNTYPKLFSEPEEKLSFTSIVKVEVKTTT